MRSRSGWPTGSSFQRSSHRTAGVLSSSCWVILLILKLKRRSPFVKTLNFLFWIRRARQNRTWYCSNAYLVPDSWSLKVLTRSDCSSPSGWPADWAPCMRHRHLDLNFNLRGCHFPYVCFIVCLGCFPAFSRISEFYWSQSRYRLTLPVVWGTKIVVCGSIASKSVGSRVSSTHQRLS